MKKTFILLTALFLCSTIIGCGPVSDKNGTPQEPLSPIVTSSFPDEPSPTKAEEPTLMTEEPTPTTELPTPTSPPPLPPMVGMGNSSLNILNAGYAVLSEDLLYYIDTPRAGNIWRADSEGENAQMLLEGKYINLNVSGGRLFFTDWYANIYVMPLGETQAQLIKESKNPSLCVFDDWLYYTNDNDIYRMRSDGSEDMLLAKDVGMGFEWKVEWQIHDGWLYYLRKTEGEDQYHIFKISLDGSERERLPGINARHFLIYEDHIYYVDTERSPYGIQKVALDGTGQQEIYKQNVILHTAADGWIYFHSKPYRDSVQGLYRIRTDGSGLEFVTEGHVHDISLADGWLFFYSESNDPAVSKMRLDGSERGFVNE